MQAPPHHSVSSDEDRDAAERRIDSRTHDAPRQVLRYRNVLETQGKTL
jgi:hypothetical protein